MWNQLRCRGEKAAASELKNTRWALLKNPADLTSDQKTTLAVIAKITILCIARTFLKKQLRAAFQAKGAPGRALLAGWLAWARRCRIPNS
jgi:transposase